MLATCCSAASFSARSADSFDEIGGMMARYSSFYWPFGHADDDLEQPSELEDLDEDGAETFEGPVPWYGTGDRYFVAMTQLPEDKHSWGDLVFSRTDNGRHGVFVVHEGGLAAGESTVFELNIYTGARDIAPYLFPASAASWKSGVGSQKAQKSVRLAFLLVLTLLLLCGIALMRHLRAENVSFVQVQTLKSRFRTSVWIMSFKLPSRLEFRSMSPVPKLICAGFTLYVMPSKQM